MSRLLLLAGKAAMNSGNYDQAISTFQKLLDRTDQTSEQRGEVYLRKGKLLEAAYDFKKACELDPENKDPLSTRARLLSAAALQTIQQAQAAAEGKGVAKGGDAKAQAKGAVAKPAPAKAAPAKPAAKGKGGKPGTKSTASARKK